jgi:hypothetical protein
MIALWLLILNKLQSMKYDIVVIVFDRNVNAGIKVLNRPIVLWSLIMRKLKSISYDLASIADAIVSKRSGF